LTKKKGIPIGKRPYSVAKAAHEMMKGPKKDVNILGSPKHDGSGKGRRANRGRGGCSPTRTSGRGRNRNR
jgi:hypothetical protein